MSLRDAVYMFADEDNPRGTRGTTVQHTRFQECAIQKRHAVLK